MDKAGIRAALSPADLFARGRVQVQLGNVAVWMRLVSAAEREEWEDIVAGKTNGKPANGKPAMHLIRAHLVQKSAVDDDGEQVWANAQEVAALPATVVVPMFEATLKLNGMSADTNEELVGNYEGGTAAN